MPGYVIADVTVTDPETYAGYRALTPGSIAAFGGRFLVRGGEHEVLAGAWAPGRLVLLGFDSPARAAAWYDSPAYVEARAIRQRASTGSLVMVDGDRPADGAGSIYLIIRHDAAGLDPEGAAAHGGRILVADATPEVKEGAWSGARVSVLAFADAAGAKTWQGAAAAGIEAVLVEGLRGPIPTPGR